MLLSSGAATASSYTIVPGGASVTVTTTVVDEKATASFSGVAGRRISLRVSNVTIGTSNTSSAQLSVLKPDGTSLIGAAYFGRNGMFFDVKTLPVSGTYRIVVDPVSTATGSATLTLYDVPPDATTPVTVAGVAATATTTVPGQNARFTFTGAVNQRVSVQVGPLCCAASVKLLSPTGTSLAAVTLSTTGGFIDTKTLTVAGTYTVLVDFTAAAVGSATVRVYSVPPDVTGPIAADGTPVTVSPSVPGQNARLTFTGTANDRISLQLGPVCCAIKVSILKPDATALVGATAFSTTGGFIGPKTLPISGTYTIFVDPQATAVGSITLKLFDVPPDVLTTTTPGGGPVSVTTTAPGQDAKITFPGTAGRGVAIAIQSVTLLPASGTFKVSVTKPDGTALVAPTTYTASGGFIDTKILPVTGTYSIVVDPQSAATVSATFRVHDVPPEATATMTPDGPPVSLVLGSPYQNGRASFSGTAGQRVSMRVGFVPSACCTVNVSILNPDGSRLVGPIAVGGGAEAFIDAKSLPVTGTYSIFVDPFGTATGTVTLTLISVAPDVTGSVAVGGSTSVTTTDPGQNARVTFSGTAGMGLTLLLGPGNCCAVKVSILKPDATTLVGGTSFTAAGGVLNMRLTVTGTHTIVIDYVGTAVGTVFLSLIADTTPPAAPSLTVSEASVDSYVRPGTTQFFYRPAGALSTFTVTATSSDAGSGLQKIRFPGLANGLTPTTVTDDFSSPYGQTYTWSTGASYSNAANVVTAFDAVGNTSTATFGVTPDSTAPTTTDNTASIGNAWRNVPTTVTLTPSDGSGSGVASTFYTINGTNPTGSSSSGTSVSLSTDGVYTVKYFSRDNVSNNEAVKTASTQIRVDMTAPATATLNALPASIRNGQVLSGSGTDALSGVASISYLYCAGTACTPSTLIGTSSTSPPYSVTWSAQPADGTYQVLARVRDNAGNTRDSAKQTITIDNSAPAAPTITAKPPNPSNTSAPTFSFAGEVGAAFECKLDAGAFAACTSPKAYSGLTDGSHTFSVQQRDAAGNVSPAASYTWTIDTVAPSVPVITSAAPNPSGSSSASFSFTGDAGATFECKIDAGAFAACTSPQSYSSLADGSHTFSVRAKDAAGNLSSADSATWTVDTAAPSVPVITVGPANPSPQASASFSFTGDAGASFECRLDGAPFAACTSPKAYSALADGSHTFDVRARDAAGNVSAAASRTWSVDTAAPAAPSITGSPTDPSASAGASFSFTGEAGASFECALDGGGFSACSSPKSYSGLADGSHTFSVRQHDAAGNVSPVQSATWNVDTTGPETSVDSGPADPTSATDATFDFSSPEAGVTFECSLDGAGFGACSSPTSYTSLAAGPHTFEVRAVDALGNVDATPAVWAWTIA